MAKICFTTLVSPNHYAWYVPIFVYSINRAYPDAAVEIFVKGKLKPDVSNLLKMCKNYTVHEDIFLDCPVKAGTCNTLRFLVPQEYFKKYDYVFIRDVDFITFAHIPTHLKYYRRIMKRGNIPYAGQGGAKKRPHCGITKNWSGKYQRIALGTLLLKQPDFWNVCGKELDKYRENVQADKHDSFDKHLPCSYFVYDEVCFIRILKKSKLPTPTRRGYDPSGKAVSLLYRDIHLGDFENYKLCTSKVFKKKLRVENVIAFKKLEKDKTWQKIVKECCLNDHVAHVISRLRKHVKKR